MNPLAPWLCGGLSPWLCGGGAAILLLAAAAVAIRKRDLRRSYKSVALGLVALTLGLGATSAPSESACFDRAIDEAVAIEDGAARRDALLALGDPRQPTQPSEAQHQRLAEALAEFPERIRPRSLEVAGPRSLASVREALRVHRAALHACVASEPLKGDDELATWTLSVEADGRVTRAARVDEAASEASPSARDTCLRRALEVTRMQPADAWSRVTVELRLLGG